jgi:large subunit ribosomal protein L35
MPKLKTHSGTKKRVRITNNGKVMRRHASGNHLLAKKSAGRKRTFAGLEEVTGKSAKNLKLKLGA